jgi:hypothetical protein
MNPCTAGQVDHFKRCSEFSALNAVICSIRMGSYEPRDLACLSKTATIQSPCKVLTFVFVKSLKVSHLCLKVQVSCFDLWIFALYDDGCLVVRRALCPSYAIAASKAGPCNARHGSVFSGIVPKLHSIGRRASKRTLWSRALRRPGTASVHFRQHAPTSQIYNFMILFLDA